MGIIAILPALYAAYVATRRSPQLAFLNVYLPVLLLLPEYYRWIVPALPDPTFSQAAILPIAFVYILKQAKSWRFTLNDALIGSFALAVGYSEWSNAGFKEAQNLMFDMIGSVVLPYVLAKGLIEPHRMRVAFARRFSWLIFLVCVISVFEFRMGMTPWQIILNRFFPGQADGWITTFRYGFARIAGPYGHAILAGLILVVGYRLQRWLEWSGAWERKFKSFRSLPFSKARLITIGIAGGVVMTLVRGPWLGAVVGAMLTSVGLAANRKRALLLIGGCTVAIGIPAAAAFYSYASVGRANAKTESQETAAYRVELVSKYIDIAIRKSYLGWGRNTWPKVVGMPSIDNYYLLLALMHGLFADAILLAIIFGTTVRLVRFELKAPVPRVRGSSFGFTLAGIFVAFGVTIATVYMGLAVMPVFAMLAGWADGYMLAPRDGSTTPRFEGMRITPKHSFRRVMA